MNEPEQPDQRYDEAAIKKMAALWAMMYQELLAHGVPGEHAVRIVETWISHTLVRT